MAVVSGAALLMSIFAGPAGAHSWYEPACCSGQDCNAVDEGVVVEMGDGVHVKGWGTLSRSDPRVRWSRDGFDHVCSMAGKLYCVYRKPNSM
jgi:hypothetical protein